MKELVLLGGFALACAATAATFSVEPIMDDMTLKGVH